MNNFAAAKEVKAIQTQLKTFHQQFTLLLKKLRIQTQPKLPTIINIAAKVKEGQTYQEHPKIVPFCI